LNRFGNTDLSRISKSIKETKRAIGASAESSELKRKRSHINARLLSLEKEIEKDDTKNFDLFQFMMMAREEQERRAEIRRKEEERKSEVRRIEKEEEYKREKEEREERRREEEL
jgi:hypothetical protein